MASQSGKQRKGHGSPGMASKTPTGHWCLATHYVKPALPSLMSSPTWTAFPGQSRFPSLSAGKGKSTQANVNIKASHVTEDKLVNLGGPLNGSFPPEGAARLISE